MEKKAICSIAFGDKRYTEQLVRLTDSIASNDPDCELFFYHDFYPPGAKNHEESMYGFKVHAIKAAKEAGFKHIIWLDPACIVKGELDYYFNNDIPIVAVKDDNLLENTISDKALTYYGDPEIIGWHLVGGSLYTWDFTKPITEDVFNHWAKAEDKGVFGTVQQAASEQINKHRNDESCLAVSLYLHGIEPQGHDLARYCTGTSSLITKRHFK